MEEAERIARREHGSGKIAVISGVGVRSYYARLGYWLDGVSICILLCTPERAERKGDTD